MRSPGVTTCSSAPCRPHTPWFEGWMENAFVAIVPTRPCPLFGRPVHRRDGSHRFRPGASPQALRIPPRGGHPALPDLRRGQRGVTPAFGYGALHPSTSGTSTHLSTSLPSAHYGSVRLPDLVHRRSTALGLAGASRGTIRHGRGWALPVLAQEASVRATGLRPRGARQRLALSSLAHVAFRVAQRRRRPEVSDFAAQYRARTCPCQRFASPLAIGGA